MPKITINEINATTQTPLNTTSGLPIALIGAATKGDRLSPTLVTNLNQFYEVFGNTAPAEIPWGWIAAKECLYIGNPVLYTRLAQNTYTNATTIISNTDPEPKKILEVMAVSPGTDGNNYAVSITKSDSTYNVTIYYKGEAIDNGSFVQGTDSDIDLLELSGVKITKYMESESPVWVSSVTFNGTSGIVNVGNAESGGRAGTDGDNYLPDNTSTLIEDIKSTLTQLQDTTLYNYLNIAIPGITHIEDSDTYVWQYLADLACGTNLTGSSFISTKDKVAIIDPAPTTVNVSTVLSDIGIENADDTDFTNMAIFYPWYKGTTINDSTVMDLPPSIQYLKVFCNLQSDGIPCRAAAGPMVSTLTRINDTRPKIGVISSETLNEMCINPIVYHRNFGYFIDGNNVLNATANSKTYQQLSIRETISYIKKRLDDICYRLSYSVNSGITRTQFQGEVTSVLDELKVSEFIYAYNVTVQENDLERADGVLNATISIFPTPSLDEFNINLRVVNVESNL